MMNGGVKWKEMHTGKNTNNNKNKALKQCKYDAFSNPVAVSSLDKYLLLFPRGILISWVPIHYLFALFAEKPGSYFNIVMYAYIFSWYLCRVRDKDTVPFFHM